MRLVDRVFQLSYKMAYRIYLLRNFVFRPSSEGVWIAVWCKGEVLLIRNSYRRCLTLPGGNIDRGERAESAAIRELHEEVGLRPDCRQVTYYRVYLNTTEYSCNRIHLYELELDVRPELYLDNREVVWGAFCLPERVLEWNLMPVLRRYLDEKAAGR